MRCPAIRLRVIDIFKILLLTCVVLVVQECTKSFQQISTETLEKLTEKSRSLSLNLGNGKCKWTPPNYEGNPNATYFKTLITGYPGGSKRIIYTQVEALTGLSVNDEWPDTLDKPNHPFMKANYPHHEGLWTWGDNMDQVMLVMRNPRHAIIEYHDVLNDIAYATTPEEAYNMSNNLYQQRAPLDQYIEWRDNRTLNEIHWYGWFIDYWMEGGLMRDIPSHNLTTYDHFKRQGQPGPYTESGQAYQDMVGNMTVEASYDPHCVNDLSCEPATIISVERILDHQQGPAEAMKIAAVLDGKEGMTVIASEARACIWRELIINKKGIRNMLDRTGLGENSYTFTDEMYQAMIDQLNRLKDKYSAPEWSVKPTVQDLLSIMDEYIVDISNQMSSNTNTSSTNTTS